MELSTSWEAASCAVYIPSLMSETQISHPCRTTGNIIVLHIKLVTKRHKGIQTLLEISNGTDIHKGTVEWTERVAIPVNLLTQPWVVPGSNFGRDIACSGWGFSFFSSDPPGKYLSIKIRLETRRYASFLTHLWSIILPPDDMTSS
jgi:hypothetical protein